MAKVNKRHQLASSLAGFTTSFIFYCGKSQHLARNTPSTVKQHSGFSLNRGKGLILTFTFGWLFFLFPCLCLFHKLT